MIYYTNTIPYDNTSQSINQSTDQLINRLTECMELGEVDPEVGHLEEILYLLCVWVLDLDERGQHTEHNLEHTTTRMNI